MTSSEDRRQAPVRLSITRIDLADVSRPGALLLEVEDVNAATARERALAWAQVRGYDRLASAIEQVLGGDPPEAGYAALINKPHALLVLATWPWAAPTPR